MKSIYLWILVVFVSIQIPAKADQIDSIRQVLSQTPDSLKGPAFIRIGQLMWDKVKNDSSYVDSFFHSATLSYQIGITYADTPTIKNSLAQLRFYHNHQKEWDKADSLFKEFQWLSATYGLELPTSFDSYNEEAGYRYTRIFNTLFIYDATGEDLEFHTVKSPEFQSSFYTNNSSLDKMQDESVYWVKVRLKGDPKRGNDYLFMINYDSYSWGYADIYIPDEEGNYQKYISGNKIDPEDKQINDWRNFFEVYIPKNGDINVYLRLSEPLRVQKIGSVFIRYMDKESIIEDAESSAMNRGVFHGVVSIQAVYFFLLFLSTRVRSYLFYVLYILGLGVFIVTAHYFTKVFPHHGYYEILGYYLGVSIAGFGLIKFAEAFLDIRKNLPKWKSSGNIFMVIFSFFIILSMIFKTWDVPWINEANYRFWEKLADNLLDTLILVCVIGLALILTWGVLLFRRGYQPARYFLIALIFLAIGFTLPALSKVFNLSYGWITFDRAMFSVQAGIILQLSFFALGVGYKRKQLEQDRQEALKQANEKLLQADRLKDEFLANTSHELRTPLNGIIGIAESLAEGVAGKPTKEMKSNLQMVVNSGRRLSGLVNDLLDFSKLRSHELELQLKPVDMKSLTQIVLTLSVPLIKDKVLDLKNNIPSGLKAVQGDENRLQQIMFNLVGNAIKFTHEGEVVVDAVEKNGFIYVNVRDTGIGIPKEKHKEIFASFEQGDGSTAREYGGTGLGLSITRQLIELHGGKISVESEPGKGAVFTISIPVSEESVSSDSLDTTTSRLISNRVESNIPSGLISERNDGTVRILVVDDEPINHQVLKNHLSGEHYSITPAMNGEEALDILDSGKMFDLVLLDLMMPRMSGYEVCQKIREKYLPSELPVIMITAKNQVSDLVEGLNLGANDYISKPFSRQEFLARIKTHLNLFNINSAYGRFVPHEFLHSLGHEFITEVKLGDQVEKRVTIFFSDIRSYTTLSEQMTPKENFDFLNSYLGRVGPVIKKNHGFVGQYIGDGIMALFQTNPDDALTASIQIQHTIEKYNLQRRQQGRIPLKLGIGLHTGSLMMGIIGDRDRMEAGVVSDAVNTASRMEGLTKHFGVSILISEFVVNNLRQKQNYHLRYLGKVQVKGRKEPLDVFDCFDGDHEGKKALKVASLDDFEKGMRAYYSKEFESAEQAFKRVIDLNPSDKAARMYLAKIETLKSSPLPDDWTGVETMLYK